MIPVLCVILVSIGAATACGYLLLQFYFDNVEQVRAREAVRVGHLAGTVVKELREHSTLITTYHEQLTTSHGYLKQALANEEQQARSLELMRDYVTAKLQNVEDTLNDGEMIRVGGNQYAFRKRRT